MPGVKTSSPTEKEQVLRKEQQLQEKERLSPRSSERVGQRPRDRDPDGHRERGIVMAFWLRPESNHRTRWGWS